MPKGVNKVTLLGHVGKDPEIRATQGGTTTANFSLATPERRKEGEEWVDHTEWHNLIAFQRTAEVVRDYVRRGSQILIEGKLQTQPWDDKESGQKKYKTVILLGGGPERVKDSTASQTNSNTANGEKGSSNSRGRKSGYSQRHEDYGDLGITDADVPF
jgi:single-strand DNA-binding protein